MVLNGLRRDGERLADALSFGARLGVKLEEMLQHLGGLGCEFAQMMINDEGVKGFDFHGVQSWSASSRARTAATAWWSRERTVPRGMPSASAMSA